MVQEEVRNYEISVWSLQDDFITVLKAAKIQRKGQTEEGELKLNVDGTQELSFSIPMYIYEGINRIENPTWYDYKHGALIANMRKIKVILNKNTKYEDVFEFLIIKVTEKHDKGELYCEVECEGLAFHELGKTGYKISLSPDDFEEEYREWFEDEERKEEDEPQENIQYWLDKFMEPYPDDNEFIDAATWYYSIEMDWSSYTQFNGKTMIPRDSNKIYEDEYVASWKLDDSNDTLHPRQVEGYKEKWRPMEVEESNKYNLTQDLAEKFGVYCKYVYEHDENYRITARRVIFYNSFIEEDKGPIDITYKYHTSSISREMDCTDLVTKMYIKAVDDDLSESGKITIMDVEANKSKEDYLLNFDYVHAVGAIDDEAYNYIETYEKEMYRLNSEIIPLQDKLITLESKLPDEEAKLTIYSNSVVKARELANDNKKALLSLARGVEREVNDNDIGFLILLESENEEESKYYYYIDLSGKQVINNTLRVFNEEEEEINIIETVLSDDEKLILGVKVEFDEKPDYRTVILKYDYYVNIISIDESLGKSAIVKQEGNTYYIDITEKWILPNTLKIYKAYNFVERKVEPNTQINIGKFEYDEYGNLIKVTNLSGLNESNSTIVYWTYEYSPQIYYTKVKETCEKNLVENSIKQEDQQGLIDNINNQINECKSNIEQYQKEKERLIKDFELLMGPALREGYWQPEDYNDYGDTYVDNFNLTTNFNGLTGKTEKAMFIWDTQPFDEEQKLYYELSLNRNKEYYPGIILKRPENNTEYDIWKNNEIDWEKIGFSYYNFLSKNRISAPSLKNSMVAGSQAELVFLKLKEKQEVFPVLLLTGFKDLSDYDRNIINSCNDVKSNEEYGCSVGVLDMKVEDGNIYMTENLYIPPEYINGNTFITQESMENNYDIVYPRIKINSLNVKNSEDQLSLTYCGKKLKPYKDYNVLTRTDENEEGYYITLNSKTLLKEGTEGSGINNKNLDILYTLSNANVSIYLDAIEVMKDSSQPQVSYSVDVAAVQKDYILQVHRMLNRIVHINDPELKFENVQGYVSEVTLNLDKPWEDSIEIKNYKTKFEDLFTKIVASTEAMQKQSYVAGIVSNAFSTDGSLQANALQPVLNNLQTTYKNGDTIFSIDPAHGIVFQNSEGILALRDGGLFGATQKITNYDVNSITTDWDWKTFITPAGINMKNVMIGQIDTNNVSIFAGDQKRFQLNADGLFAYKETDENNSVAESPYVVLNSEGLFHREKKENEDKFINMVEVSWNGFILRNKKEQEVFKADKDGNLTLTGTVNASSGWFGSEGTGFHIGSSQSQETQQFHGYITDNADIREALEGWDLSAHRAPVFWLSREKGDIYDAYDIWGYGPRFNDDGEINTLLPFWVNRLGQITANTLHLRKNLTIDDSQVTSGFKSRLIQTDQYANRLLYCYETPTPMFGDMGEGKISEDGYCYISFDSIFAQTIATTQYQVFLQKYGEGDCWILERYGAYFIVQGTPNLKFSWEIKAKQRDYDQLRLEKYEEEPFQLPGQNYGKEAELYINNLKQGRILE